MLTMNKSSKSETIESVALSDAISVCRRIPPLWDLRNYVAVNPFLGFSTKSISATAEVMSDQIGAQLFPKVDDYREAWKAGEFDATDLSAAARRENWDPKTFLGILEHRMPTPQRTSRLTFTHTEEHDRKHGTDWNGEVIRSAARWCAVYAEKGGRFGGITGNQGLFATWREATVIDRSLEIAGLRGYRRWAASLPQQPEATIERMLDELEISPASRPSYLYRLLGSLYGWACYFRRKAWEADPEAPGMVMDLLAIRLSLDTAVATLAAPIATNSPRPILRRVDSAVENESVRLVFQTAWEDGFMRQMQSQIRPIERAKQAVRPQVQVVFCIDVRSEPLRRHLEAESPEIETRGFAGFFGVPLSWRANREPSARCPVLLKPRVPVNQANPEPSGLSSGSWRRVVAHLQSAPAAAFSFVELLGLAYGVRLTKDSLSQGGDRANPEGVDAFDLDHVETVGAMAISDQVELAAGILKNMGFSKTFARIVLLCGHEGCTANNSHAAGLDCGACGGHSGAINARVAAAFLNDHEIRKILASKGWGIPSDTHFLPGVHNTTTDAVRLLDVDQVPAGHHPDMVQLQNWLASAGDNVRQERSGALGLKNHRSSTLKRILSRRSRDWSEVRPEWGLARNAAFIAARRCRTRGVNLHGRAFLHEYDASIDADGSILNLILSAPMVVASWINLQYFASTVDNAMFGAGDKAIHNRVGAQGVVLGNGGDLRSGLPVQSVHTANGKWFHEPLRLQVIVEAAPEQIERVLEAQPTVQELVENGWVRLFALHPFRVETSLYLPGRGWESSSPAGIAKTLEREDLCS